MLDAPRPVAAFATFATFAGWGALTLALALGVRPAQAAGPQVNLTVTWRVDDASQAQSQTRVVQGQVIVDSRGQVIGRTGVGATTVETERPQQSEQSVRVLNGGQARLYVGRQVARQSWQLVWSPQGSATGTGTGTAAATGTSAGANPYGGSYGVQSQVVWVDLGDGLVVRPRWGGGRQAVLLDIEARSSRSVSGGATVGAGFEPDGQVGRTEVATTLSLPLGQWTPVARSGSARSQHSERAGGLSLSTRDVDEQAATTLWVRVSADGITP